jgi:hypothetical protein
MVLNPIRLRKKQLKKEPDTGVQSSVSSSLNPGRKRGGKRVKRSLKQTRHTRLLMEGVALVLAMGGMFAGYLAWRLSIGTVSIVIATPLVEDAVARLVGGPTKIGTLRLGWDPEARDFVVLAGQITARTDKRTSPLRLGQVDMALDAPSLLAGRAVVKQARLSGVEAVLVIDQSGRTAFGFGTAQEVLALPRVLGQEGALAHMIQATRKALDPTGQAGRVAQVVLSDAQLQVIDPDSGERMVLEGAQAGLYRNEVGIITFHASGKVSNSPSSINIALAAPPDPQGILSVIANVNQVRIAQIPRSLRQGQLERLVSWTSPLGGRALGHLTPNGKILDAAGHIEVGAGQVAGFVLDRAKGQFSWQAKSGIIRLVDASVSGHHIRGEGLQAVVFPLNNATRRIDLDAKSFAIENVTLGGLTGTQVKGRLSLTSQARLQSTQLNAKSLSVSATDTRTLTLMDPRLTLSAGGLFAQNKSSTVGGLLAGGVVQGAVRATRLALTDRRGSLGLGDRVALDFSKQGAGTGWQGSASLASLNLVGRGAAWPQTQARGLSARLVGLGTPSQTAINLKIDSMRTRQIVGRGLGLSGSNVRVAVQGSRTGAWAMETLSADALGVVTPVLGIVSGPLRASGTLSKLGLQDGEIQTSSLSLSNPAQLPRPFVATDVSFDGDILNRKVVFRGAQLRHRGIDVEGSGEVALAPRGSAKVYLDARIDGEINVETLLSAWPRGFLRETRNAIAQVVRTGMATTSQLTLRIPPGLLKNQIGGPEMMALDFDVREGTVQYLPGMTALTNVSGRARLRGNSFRVDVDRGNLGELTLNQGYFAIPQFAPKDALAVVQATVTGSVARMASEVDREPLRIFSNVQFDPARLAGEGRLDLDLSLPLSDRLIPDAVNVRARGHFEKASLRDAFAGLEAKNGSVDLDVAGQRVKVAGKAHLAGNAFDFVWQNQIDSSSGRGNLGEGSQLLANGLVDLASLSQLGVDVSAYAKGPVQLSVDVQSQVSQWVQADVLADVQSASIEFQGSSWSKPAGVPGLAKARIVGQPGLGWQISGLEFETKGASVRGQLALSDQMNLKMADFSHIKIKNLADIGFKLDQDNGTLDLAIVGDYLDLSPFRSRGDVTERAVSMLTQPMWVKAQIKQVATGPISSLSDFEATIVRDKSGWRSMRITGQSPAGPTQIEMKPQADGRRTIYGTLSDAGFFARLMYPAAPLSGGTGTIYGELPIVGAKSEGSLSLEVKNISFVQANQTQIAFDLVRLPMSVSGGLLSLRDGKADGAAYTVKAEGYVDFEAGQMDLRGVATPGGLNRVFGEVPLIGGLLGGGEDEGLVGLTFSAQGSLADPKLRTNPISALAPGFLRKLFETQAPTEPHKALQAP